MRMVRKLWVSLLVLSAGCGALSKAADAGRTTCGGFAGFTCAASQKCVDDPADDCVPGHGADCPGVCVDP